MLRSRQRRVGTDAAVWEEAAVVLGVVELAHPPGGFAHAHALDRVGIGPLRHRHFAGRGVAALAAAEQLFRQLLNARRLPPVLELAAQGRAVGAGPERGAGVDLLERRTHRGDVAAMAVDEKEAFEAV